MTVITKTGSPIELSARMQVVDLLLSSRKLIGARRWGMVQLYYRAGLSHQNIGDIFGLTRQAVTSQLRRAFKLVLWAVLTRHPKAEHLAVELTDRQRREIEKFVGEGFSPNDEEENTIGTVPFPGFDSTL